MDSRRAVRELLTLPAGLSARVAGRIVALSDASFTLQDDSGRIEVQWAPDAAPLLAADAPLSAASVQLGMFADVNGSWNGSSLVASDVQLSGRPNERFARAEGDFTQLIGKRMDNLRLRHAVLRALRDQLDVQGMLEVETPAMVPCPGLDVHLDAIEVLGMRAPRWLHTSPEYQMKRLLVTTVPGIYQIGKAFRRGERGKLHEPEFTMLEWYRSFADADSMMRDTEALVAAVAHTVLGSTRIAGLNHAVDVALPWDRITVEDAFNRYAGVTLESVVHDDDRFYRLLTEKVEPELGREHPVFLTHYPARMASLARLCPDDARYAERFEAYIDGVELCNGFSELVDAAEQRKRLQADQTTRGKVGRSVYPLDERFLDALEDGIPASAGNALGVDRLVMLLAGAKHIDEVVAFSSTRV